MTILRNNITFKDSCGSRIPPIHSIHDPGYLARIILRIPNAAWPAIRAKSGTGGIFLRKCVRDEDTHNLTSNPDNNIGIIWLKQPDRAPHETMVTACTWLASRFPGYDGLVQKSLRSGARLIAATIGEARMH